MQIEISKCGLILIGRKLKCLRRYVCLSHDQFMTCTLFESQLHFILDQQTRLSTFALRRQ